jgi:hypothetical protein
MADKVPVVKDEPAGTYQVWHRDGEAFRHVANVEAGNYMAAVVLPMFKRGATGTERVTWLIDSARPTTFGDKIVDPRGAAYELYTPDLGGVALRETSMPGAETSASRDVTTPAPASLHPWPSEIAKANRQKQAVQDQEKSNAQDKSNGHDDGHSM